MEVLDFGFLILSRWGGSGRARTLTAREDHETPPSCVPATVATLTQYWPEARQHSWNDIYRAASLLDRLSEAIALPGDVVECGVSRGGTALLLAAALEAFAPDKKLYLFDSFQGLPDVTADDRSQWYSRGDFAATRDGVCELLARHGLAERCIVVSGWFDETLRSLAGVPLCMAHVDCDLHRSTMDCLTHLYSAIADGGPIVFDDYSDGSGGERAAVNAHAARTGEVVHIGPYSQAYLYKGETRANTRARDVIERRWEQRRVHMTLSGLHDNAPYLEHVTSLLGRLRDMAQGFEAYERLCRGAARRNGSAEVSTCHTTIPTHQASAVTVS